MAELETWAVVTFTAVLAFVEVHRLMSARIEKRLQRVQRKIELAFNISGWHWTSLAGATKTELLQAARIFQELTTVLDFPGDQVIENDVRDVLGGLMAILRESQGVDKSQSVARVQERIQWGVMGWVEESERLRRSWWLG